MIKFASFSEYAQADFACRCGRRHATDIKKIRIDSQATGDLPAILAELEPHAILPGRDKLLLVADENTWSVAGQDLSDILEKAGYLSGTCIFPGRPDLVPDERAVFRLLTEMEAETSCLVSVGSGTLNDLTRFVSFKTGKPYVCVATAPSMDGYASTMAPMIHNNMKITYTTHGPAALVADPAVLAACPGHMLAAGLGDILGKYTALADWTLAVLAQDEYYCPEIAGLIRRTADESLQGAPRLADRDSAAVQQVMEALLMTGFAMSYAGNSRPASGAEHHMSHYWEMLLMQRQEKPVLHGTKVGLGTIAICALYHSLPQLDVDFDRAVRQARRFDFSAWEKEMRQKHGAMASELVRQVQKEDVKNIDKMTARIEALSAKWGQVLALAGQVPEPAAIREALAQAGGATHPEQVGITRDDVARAVRYACDFRPRYSILQMCGELAVSDQAIRVVDEIFYS